MKPPQALHAVVRVHVPIRDPDLYGPLLTCQRFEVRGMRHTFDRDEAIQMACALAAELGFVAVDQDSPRGKEIMRAADHIRSEHIREIVRRRAEKQDEASQ